MKNFIRIEHLTTDQKVSGLNPDGVTKGEIQYHSVFRFFYFTSSYAVAFVMVNKKVNKNCK
jgi:hypothetical protein